MPSSALPANAAWPRARFTANYNGNAAASPAAETTASLRLSCASHAGNPLQIVDEAYSVPAREQLRKRVPLAVANFEQQPGAGYERCLRLRYQTPIHIEARRSSKERQSRFEITHLRIEHFILGDIRRIRHDHIEASARNTSEQIRLAKANAVADVMARSVVLRESECRQRDIERGDMGLWERMGERHGDRARAGADVGDTQPSFAVNTRQCRLDQMLCFRTW